MSVLFVNGANKSDRSYISVLNSSAAALTGGATYIGNWEDTVGYTSLIVAVKADVDGTMYVDFSPDGSNIDSTITYNIPGGTPDVHRLVITRQYFRLRYVNGSSAQTYMRLQTTVGCHTLLSSPLNLLIQQDADAIVSRTIDAEITIAQGLFQNYSITNKFGKNSDVDTATVPEDIWEGGGAYTGFPTGSAEALRVTSSSADDAAAGIGARTIRITGLDADYNILSETVTLNGTSNVVTSGTFLRVHTAMVMTAGSNNFNVGTITIRHNVTTANIFLSMQPSTNQTNSSGYTVPAGYTAYMKKIHGNIRGGTSAIVDGAIWQRSLNQAPRLRRPFTIGLNVPLRDEIYGGLTFTEKTDLILRITLSTANNVEVTGGYDLIVVKN